MNYQKGNIAVIIAFVIVIFLVGFSVYGLSSTMKSKDVDTNSNALSENQEVKQDTKTQSHTPTKTMDTNKRLLSNFTPVSKIETLQKVDLVSGAGAEVKPGDTVSVHYTGAVASTGEVFQSSKDFGTKPITFPLSGVIKGWTDGIPGMKVGGTRRLLIPSSQAYGATPPPGSGIPVNADLVFDVELIAIGQ